MLDLSSVRGIPVAYLTGDLDIASAPQIAEPLLAEARKTRRLVVSFERCRYCDSFGLNVLVSLRNELGKAFAVAAPDGTQIRRVLDIAEMSRIFPIFDDTDAAVRAIERQ